MEEPLKVAPGDLLAGKYRVESVLGSGGMGQVVRAVHADIGRVVAIKLLHGVLSDEAIGRFRREARAAANLTSEFVCKTFDFGTTEDGEPYIVMEHLEGSALDSYARARALPVERAVDFVLMAASALAEAHLAGIVHRDVKPANLFVTKRVDGSYAVKVLDFGISKEAEGSASITHSSSALGTPLYMSPEQIRSSKNVDPRADVWSLGVVLYELLTGRLPFEGEGVNGVLASILENKPRDPMELRPSLSPGLAAVVLRCLEKSAGARVSSMRELARLLAPFGSTEGRFLGEKTARIGSLASIPPPSDGAPALSALAETQDAGAMVPREAGPNKTATDMSMRTPRRASGGSKRTWFGIAGAALGVGALAAWFLGRGPQAPEPTAGAQVVLVTATAPASAPPRIEPAPVQTPAPSGALEKTEAPSATPPPSATAAPSATARPHGGGPKRPPPKQPPGGQPSLF